MFCLLLYLHCGQHVGAETLKQQTEKIIKDRYSIYSTPSSQTAWFVITKAGEKPSIVFFFFFFFYPTAASSYFPLVSMCLLRNRVYFCLINLWIISSKKLARQKDLKRPQIPLLSVLMAAHCLSVSLMPLVSECRWLTAGNLKTVVKCPITAAKENQKQSQFDADEKRRARGDIFTPLSQTLKLQIKTQPQVPCSGKFEELHTDFYRVTLTTAPESRLTIYIYTVYCIYHLSNTHIYRRRITHKIDFLICSDEDKHTVWFHVIAHVRMFCDRTSCSGADLKKQRKPVKCFHTTLSFNPHVRHSWEQEGNIYWLAEFVKK